MISNSSPLIVFGKLNKLDLLLNLFKTIDIAESVYEEVVKKGRDFKKSEAYLIEEYIKKGLIKIKKLNEESQNKSSFLRESHSKLDKGESDTIALTLQEKEKKVIIDEKIARKIAEIYDISPIGVLGILLLSYNKNLINESELRSIIEELILENFRVGAEVIHEFWKMFERLKKNRNK